IRLSFKNGSKGHTDVEPPSWKVLAGYAVATTTQFGHAVYQATSTVDKGAYSHDPMSVKDWDIGLGKFKDGVAQHIDQYLSAYAGAALPAVNVATAAAEWLKKKGQEEASKVFDNHNGPDGEIALHELGAGIGADKNKERITLEKDEGIFLKSEKNKIEAVAKKNIDLESETADITFKCNTSKFKKCVIDHKNFKALS
ncbi:MAG: hypothetical protein AAF961_10270, partial [Planctomycetota bacterium]